MSTSTPSSSPASSSSSSSSNEQFGRASRPVYDRRQRHRANNEHRNYNEQHGGGIATESTSAAAATTIATDASMSNAANDTSNDTSNDTGNHNNTTTDEAQAQADDSSSSSFYRLVAEIAYDGTTYQGFQTQLTSRTIQDVLEVRLSRLFDRRVHVAASGRTDAGVHARGQIVHFDVPRNVGGLGRRAAGHLRKVLQQRQQQLEDTDGNDDGDGNGNGGCATCCKDLATALENTLVADAWRVEGGSKGHADSNSQREALPCDIQILRVSPAPSNTFHAREDCIGKRYVYTIQEGSGNPMTARYRWRLGRNKRLDVPRMNAAARMLIGRHDFSTFGLIEANDPRTPHKRMRRLEVSRIESIDPTEAAAAGCLNTDAAGTVDAVVTIVAECDRFLYNMMRMISGTLVDVGLGRIRPEDVAALLDRRTRAGGRETKRGAVPKIRKAPACGLCLHRCFYEPEETDAGWMDSAALAETPGTGMTMSTSTDDDIQAALALLQL